MKDALRQARYLFDEADDAARECIKFSSNRLRVLFPSNCGFNRVLSDLKRELRAWDINKQSWKSPR
jgi:hypothetical protein